MAWMTSRVYRLSYNEETSGEGSDIVSVNLQHEAFRQRILAATRLLSACMATYWLSKEWERCALKDKLHTLGHSRTGSASPQVVFG